MNLADPRAAIDAAYRNEGRRVFATLIRLLGSFDAAEEALHEAFVAAAEQWPRKGVPTNPYAWLVSAGRFKLIDRWRRYNRLARALPELATLVDCAPETLLTDAIEDDQLRLIFACCHPLLASDARIALTLREVAGLTTEEIARAFGVPAPTIAQRIVRAKAKFRDESIPYEIPERSELPARVESALQVIYLIFNEGYAATAGPDLIRHDLCAEAIRLGRLVVDLLADSEAQGLLSLMLLHEARLATRVDSAGDLILLADQDRSLWNSQQILEAQEWLERALATHRIGSYVLQAAIAELHSTAPSLEKTDWCQIVSLYDTLLQVEPSPVVALNRAVAICMRDGAEAGMIAIEAALQDGCLRDHHLAHSALAEMHMRLGDTKAATACFQRALELASQLPERRFLQARIEALAKPG